MFLLAYLACTPPVIDLDGDGFVEREDCDDGDASVFPGASERCNGHDDDCDGRVDASGDTLPAGAPWYADADADGHGDPSRVGTACSPPPGAVADGDDCDDAAAAVWPGAPEVCDGIDQDCDGVVDDGAPGAAWAYPDADGDGYGAPPGAWSCLPTPGWVADGTDCDDGNPVRHPGAGDAAYDGIDADCGGEDDYDSDSDGVPVSGVEHPDCDDSDPAVHPGAAELCGNGADDDCDAQAPGCGIVGERSLDDADAIWPIDAAWEGALVGVGDLDGDGRVELLFGDTSATNAAGEVGAGRVVAVTALAPGDSGLVLVATVEGAANRTIGATAAAGDTDGDGVFELVVGAPTWADNAGGWLRVAGPTGTTSLAMGALEGVGAEGDAAGYALALLDLDGDGLDDLLSGAPGWDAAEPRVGQVTVTSASASLRLAGSVRNGSVGVSVRPLGDLDGDGGRDLALGMFEGVWLVHGPIDADQAYSEGADALLVSSGLVRSPELADAGDTDGDGLSDVLVCDATGAWLFRSPVVGRLLGEEAGATFNFGASPPGALTGAGDLNGDGFADVAIGSALADTTEEDPGVVRVWSGPIAGAQDAESATASLWGPSAGAGAGSAVVAVGDLDGDGFDDLVVQGAADVWTLLGGVGW